MLPVELLRHIFSYISDPQCFDTVYYQPSKLQRYQFEYSSGRKELATKRALLLVSKTFYTVAQELAWSWISIFSNERLRRIDTILNSQENTAYWIRRLEVQLSFEKFGYDNSAAAVQALARILSKCANLEVYISDISVASVDCQRTAPIIINKLKALPNLRRLDFAGHEGPSVGDYIESIPHLGKLQQLLTGRIGEKDVDEDQLPKLVQCYESDGPENYSREEEEIRVAMSLPSLQFLQLSSRPIYSCWRLFIHLGLPSLTHLSIQNADFYGVRCKAFFETFGPQLTHLYTNDIRTAESPFGYARILSICPNLKHLTFSPRLKDDRHHELWRHDNLQTLALRGTLPSSIPAQILLADNISRSVADFTELIVQSCINGDLPCLETIRIEDVDNGASELERRYGASWDEICQRGGLRLEDAHGRRIPWELPDSPNQPLDKIKKLGFVKRFLKSL
jgi:hypothetical protein